MIIMKKPVKKAVTTVAVRRTVNTPPARKKITPSVKKEVKPVKAVTIEDPPVETIQDVRVSQQSILANPHMHVKDKARMIAGMFTGSDLMALESMIKRYPVRPGGKTWWNWNGAKWEKKEGI
jgi:hypothetical protein